MPPLWERNCRQPEDEGKIVIRKYSPKESENLKSLARDSKFMFFEKRCKKAIKNLSTIKGTSLSALPADGRRGSMSVEAALVLPLFLFFFLNLGSVMEMMRLHGRLETALWETGREMRIYGYALRALQGEEKKTENGSQAEERESLLSEIGDLALSYTYVKGRIKEYLGESYLNASPIRGGSSGLHFPSSDLRSGDDEIEIVLTYRIEPFWKLSGFRTFLMENRYYGRMWTGYDIRKAREAVYYLTENAEVYHLKENCTYLMLSVQKIRKEKLETATNKEGRRYRACEKCVAGWIPEEIYVAKEGECYHIKRDCSGLKRTYRAVTWEEAKNYRPCSRCGAEKEN